jgi:hypothetical protein
MYENNDVSNLLAVWTVLLSAIGNFADGVDMWLSIVVKVLPIITLVFYFLINIEKIFDGWNKFKSLFNRNRK